MSKIKCPSCGFADNDNSCALCIQCGAILKEAEGSAINKAGRIMTDMPTEVFKSGQITAEPPTMKVERQKPQQPAPTPEPPTVVTGPARPAAFEPPTMKVARQKPQQPAPTPEPPTVVTGPAKPAAFEPPTMKVERQKPQQPASTPEPPTVVTGPAKPAAFEPPTMKVAKPSPSSSQLGETPTVVVRPQQVSQTGEHTLIAGDSPTVQVKPSSKPMFFAKLTIKHGGRKGIEFPVTLETMSIGRWDADSGSFPEIDLTPDDSDGYISRRHAKIYNQDGKWFIEDMGSVNGTFVNKGARLLPKRPCELHNGDEIILGKIFFTFTAG